jgi:cell division protein FtsW
LLLQPDNGNALLCVALAVAMGLAAGVRIRWLALAAAPVVPVLLMAVTRHGYAMERISRWISEEPHYQVRQSLLAIQRGGATGEGIGAGWRKMDFVPEAQNDFIFAIIGEELGFLGSLLVIASFTLIGIVGCRLVLQLRDPFHRYVVFGCTVAICAQALINLLVATGMAPAKGIDLPFVGAGGTNLVASLGAVGLIGNAARSDRTLQS